MSFWNTFQLKENQHYMCRIGSLVLWMIRKDTELLISEQRLVTDEELGDDWESKIILPRESENPDRSNWKRWIVDKGEFSLRFIPVTPDRPVVVRPENQVQLTVGKKTCFFVSIPLFIRIVTTDNQVLAEIPTQILSNTWFGEPVSGEFSYAVKSGAVTSIDRKKPKVYTAICPICIENESSKLFNFARLSVHTEYLGVFRGENHLWTNQIFVKLEGDDQKSMMDISEGAPDIDTVKEKLSESREVPSKKFYKKMFSDFSFIKG